MVRLLAPMEETSTGLVSHSVLACYLTTSNDEPLQTFARGLLGANWTRFKFYATRVRRLSQREADGKHPDPPSERVAQETISAIMFNLTMNGGTPLLPQMTDVQWFVSRSQTMLFLLPFVSPTTLKNLQLWGPTTEALSTTQVLYGLEGLQMSGLRSFAFTVEDPDSPVRMALASFLLQMKKLENLELSGFTPSLGVTEAMRSLVSLRSAKLTFDITRASGLKSFLGSLAEACTLLRMLQLTLEGGLGSVQTIPFKNIRPLLQCHHLTHLRITHPRLCIVLNRKGVMKMGQAWSGMEELELCTDARSRCGTPVRLLKHIAAALGPSLKTLGMPFVTDGKLPPTRTVTEQFPCLLRLGVGSSLLFPARVQPVTEYLGVLCPLGVEIKSRQTGSSAATWREVKTLLGVLHRVHLQRLNIIPLRADT